MVFFYKKKIKEKKHSFFSKWRKKISNPPFRLSKILVNPLVPFQKFEIPPPKKKNSSAPPWGKHNECSLNGGSTVYIVGWWPCMHNKSVNELRGNPTWWLLSLKKLPCDLKDHRQHGLIKQIYFDKRFLEINNHIPANFFWVKCVRFSPCHECLIRKRPSVFRGLPIIFRNLLNFTENFRKCSDDLWALRKTRQP